MSGRYGRHIFHPVNIYLLHIINIFFLCIIYSLLLSYINSFVLSGPRGGGGGRGGGPGGRDEYGGRQGTVLCSILFIIVVHEIKSQYFIFVHFFLILNTVVPTGERTVPLIANHFSFKIKDRLLYQYATTFQVSLLPFHFL